MDTKYFPMFHTYLDMFAGLTDEQFGRVFRAGLTYATSEKVLDLPPLEALAFAVIRCDIDRAKVKYDAIAKRNKVNGEKGGRPKNPENPVGFLETQKTQTNPEKPKKPIEKEKEKEKEKENAIGSVGDEPAPTRRKKAEKKDFIPPTVEEVQEYCTERGLDTIDPEYFVSYYTESDWIKQNGEPVRNWKSTLLTWAQRDKRDGKTAPAKLKTAQKSQPAGSSFDTDSFFEAALMRTYGDNRKLFKEGTDG